MNKFWIAILSLFLINLAIAETNDSAYEAYLNKQATIAQERFIALEQQKQAALVAQQAAAQNKQNLSVPKPSLTSVTNRCDCYDNSDNHNIIANNFLYDQNGERAFRKNPACKCLPKDLASNNAAGNQLSNVINPLATSANTDYNQSNHSGKSSNNQTTTPPVDFGIKY